MHSESVVSPQMWWTRCATNCRDLLFKVRTPRSVTRLSLLTRRSTWQAALYVLCALYLLASALAGEFKVVFTEDDLTKGDGQSFTIKLTDDSIHWPWVLPTDDLVNSTWSTLEVYVNGIKLGPAHSLYREIRDFGEGRYSHWGEALYVSLPPSIAGPNDLQIVATAPLELSAWIAIPGVASVLLSVISLSTAARWAQDRFGIDPAWGGH